MELGIVGVALGGEKLLAFHRNHLREINARPFETTKKPEAQASVSKQEPLPRRNSDQRPIVAHHPLPTPTKGLCREDRLQNCSTAEIYQRVIDLINHIQVLIDDMNRRNKSAHDVINAASMRRDPDLANISNQQMAAYNDFVDIDLNKYRAEYGNAVVRYRNELVARLGQRQTSLYFDEPRNVNHLRDIIKDLSELAEELKSKSPPMSQDCAPGANCTTSSERHGGINVQQATTGDNSPIINSPITIGDVPKRIASGDRDTLSHYLLKAKKKLRVRVDALQGSNSKRFADDLFDVFKKGQWDVGTRVYESMGMGEKFPGAVVSIKERTTTASNVISITDDDALFYVGKVLDKLKVPCVLIQNPNMPEDLIDIRFEGLPDTSSVTVACSQP